jgi:uncharacterized membrane protein
MVTLFNNKKVNKILLLFYIYKLIRTQKFNQRKERKNMDKNLGNQRVNNVTVKKLNVLNFTVTVLLPANFVVIHIFSLLLRPRLQLYWLP